MTVMAHLASGMAALVMAASPVSEPGNLSNAIRIAQMPKAETTGEWAVNAIDFLEEGDRVHGEVFRAFVDPLDFEGGEQAVQDLIDGVRYFQVEKPSKKKVRLIAFMEDEKNVKRKFMADSGKMVKVTLRHNKTKLIMERLSSERVMMKVRGVGAAYGGAPIPESLMRMIVNKDRLEVVEVAGIDIDQNERISLPEIFAMAD